MERTAAIERTPSLGDRRRVRGPFSRWPRAADAALALVLFVASVSLADGPGDTMVLRGIDDVPLLAVAAIGVGSVALYWRRRAPIVVLAVVLAAWSVTLGSGYADLGGLAIVALYSVGRYVGCEPWGPVGVAAAIVVINIDGLLDPAPWGEAAFGAVVMFVAWYVGRRLRSRGERAEQLRREQEAEARRIVAEERARIARELHDVVAHRVSLMTVQAGAAKAVAAHDPQAALDAMGAVEQAGRQALDELRHLLGVLRPEAASDGLGPQPGLADVPRLVEEVGEAGLVVTLVPDGGLPTGLPVRVDLFAYRIVQEALTNALKHAGPGTRVEIRLSRSSDGRLVVDVVDDGGPGAVGGGEVARQGGGGHGLVGMRERALLLGGTLDAGPRDGGGFRVLAQLPFRGEPS